MASTGTQRFVLFSSPNKYVPKADGESSQSYSIEKRNTLQPTLDSRGQSPTTEISFKVSSNETSGDDSEVASTKESTEVIWTYQTLSGAPTELMVTSDPCVVTAETEIEERTNGKDTENVNGGIAEFTQSKRGSGVFQRNNISQAPTFGQMKNVKYSSIQFGTQNEPRTQGQEQDNGNSSMPLPESTNKSAPQSSYAYKIQEGVAVLQHVRRNSEVNEQTSSSESEHKSESKIIHKEEHLATDSMLGAFVGVRSTSLDRSPNQGSTGIDVQNQTMTVEKIEHTEAISTKVALQPQISSETFPGKVIKAFEASMEYNQSTTRSADTGFTGQSMAPPRVNLRNSSEWISTKTARYQDVTSSTASSTPNKLSTEKIQYYQKHDSMPNITLHIHSKPKKPMVSNTSSPECGSVPIKGNLESCDAKYSSSEEKPTVFQTQVKTDASKLNFTAPGKIKIPNFDKRGPSVQEKERSLPPKVEKINTERKASAPSHEDPRETEQWIMPSTRKDMRSESCKMISPDFNQPSSYHDLQILPPSVKLQKINTEQWITQTTEKREQGSEVPVSIKRLSKDKLQFLVNDDSQSVNKSHDPLPGKVVIPEYSQEAPKEQTVESSKPGKVLIPNFNQETSIKHKESLPLPPKTEKINMQQWMAHMTEQNETKDPPCPTNKISTQQLQFLQIKQDFKNSDKPSDSLPGKVVIAEFNRKRFDEAQEQELPNMEHRITSTIREDVRSELPSLIEKLPTDQVQFLDNPETQKGEIVQASLPNKLVIPDFNQSSPPMEAQGLSVPSRRKKINDEQWITPSLKKEELNSEMPSVTKKLSVEKLQFLHKDEPETEDKRSDSIPGKLVIPTFNQGKSSSVERAELTPPAKLGKINAEPSITQTSKQEEMEKELLSPTKKLAAEKMQFLENHEPQRDEALHSFPPGKLVIPDFNKENSYTVDDLPPPPEPAKLDIEQWIIPNKKQAEPRSDPPSPTKKLSVEKMNFLQRRDEQNVEPSQVSRPGKLVIPDFNKESSSTEKQKISPPPSLSVKTLSKEEVLFLENQKDNEADRVKFSSSSKLVIPDFLKESSFSTAQEEKQQTTQVTSQKLSLQEEISPPPEQKEVGTDFLPSLHKFTSEKVQFLHNDETRKAENVPFPKPGKLVIPNFNQSSSNLKEEGLPTPQKLEKIKTDQWITKQTPEVELRSELPSPAKKVSADKLQFTYNQETEKTEKRLDAMPGKIVIPEFNPDDNIKHVNEISRHPKPSKLCIEQWAMPNMKQEKQSSELPSPAKKLSEEQLQFLHNEELHTVANHTASRPGKFLIPDFNQESSFVEGQNVSPPTKLHPYDTEEWITPATRPEEREKRVSLVSSKLSIKKMQFPQKQETQKVENVNTFRPGKIVIPDFHQNTYSPEVGRVSLPPKGQSIIKEQWITQTTKQQEMHTEVAPTTNKLLVEKIQFLDDHERKVEKSHTMSPGKLVIPEFNQESTPVEENERPTPPKLETSDPENWIMRSSKQEELNSEIMPVTNKLSKEKLQFLHKEETESIEKHKEVRPGRIAIPNFNQESVSERVVLASKPDKITIPLFNPDSSIIHEEPLPSPPKLAEQWMTEIKEQEEGEEELQRPKNKLSLEKLEFLQKQETTSVKKSYEVKPGKLVITEFQQEIPAKVKRSPAINERHQIEEWITEGTEQTVKATIKDAERRSEIPSPTKKLSVERMQFFQSQEEQKDKTLPRPGKLVISDFNQENPSSGEQNTSLPPKDRIAEQWITHKTKEEVRSDLPVLIGKMSLERIQLTQGQESHEVDGIHPPSPGKIVIPDFSKSNSTKTSQEQLPDRKVGKITAEQWITHNTDHEEAKTEQLPQTKKLSVEKLQFLQNKETQCTEKDFVTIPDQGIIPELNTKTAAIQNISALPKFQSHYTEERITKVIEKEEVQAQVSLPRSQLSMGRIQFPDNTDAIDKDKPPSSIPGKLVIPDFNQNSYSTNVQEQPPPGEPAKLNTELWITPTFKQVEHKVDLQSPTKKLSTDKLRFLEGQEATKEEKPLSIPGKLVIPDFNQESSNVEGQKLSRHTKEQTNISAEWITNVIEKEEMQAKVSLPRSQLLVGKTQSPNNTDAIHKDKAPSSIPGKLVIPDFNQDTYHTNIQEQSPPRELPSSVKGEKFDSKQGISQETKEVQMSTPPNKLPVEKKQFLQNQERKNIKSSHTHGKIVIPNFDNESSSIEAPAISSRGKGKSQITEQWITQQKVIEEEVLPPIHKKTAEKVEVLGCHETETSDKPITWCPGKLVTPEFNQSQSIVKSDEVHPFSKPAEINTEQWITMKQNELKSASLRPTKKLSVEKIEFLQNKEEQNNEKVQVSSPGKLVIPHFIEQSSLSEEHERPSPPRVERIHADQWITQAITQEVVKGDPPPSPRKLLVEKTQFLNDLETERIEKVSTPAKIVIPDFQADSSGVEAENKASLSTRRLCNTEEWMTRAIKQEEVMADMPPPIKKMSMQEVQFLNKHEVKMEEPHAHASSPGKLVIPDFIKDNSSQEGQEPVPSTKPAKLNTEQWMIRTVKENESRSGLQSPTKSSQKLEFLQNKEAFKDVSVQLSRPGKVEIQKSSFQDVQEASSHSQHKYVGSPNKLSHENFQFLRNEETQGVKTATVGKLTIPDFNQHSSSTVAQEQPYTVKQEEIHESKSSTKSTVPSPRKLVIPEFGVHSFSVDIQNVGPSERDQDHEQQVTCSDLTSEKHPNAHAAKLSAEGLHCFQNQDAQKAKVPPNSIPGKVVIPNFDRSASPTKAPDTSEPVKASKLNAEQWIKQSPERKDLRSEVPSVVAETVDRGIDRMKFIFVQDTQVAKISPTSAVPGELVIPDFHSDDYHCEELKMTSIPKGDKRFQEQGKNVEESSQTNNLSALKMQFVNTQEVHSVNKAHEPRSGKLVIPDFSKSSSSSHVYETLSLPEEQRRNKEEWLTHSMTLQELRTTPLPVRNRLTEDRMQPFQTQQVCIGNEVDVAFPGRIGIPGFSQKGISEEESDALRSPESHKRNSLKLIFQANGKDLRREELSTQFAHDKQSSLSADRKEVSPQSKLDEHNSLRLVFGANGHEARPEAALRVNRLAAERLQFSNNDQPTLSEDKANSFPSKLGKRNSLKLVFEANGQEIKPEVTPQVKKLSAERLQFSQNVQPNFAVEEREVPRPSNLAKRNSLRLVFEADGLDVKPEVRRSVNRLPAERMPFSQDAKSILFSEGKEVALPPNMGKQNSLKLVFEANGQGRVKPEVTPQVNKLSGERLQLSQNAQPNFTMEERQVSRSPNLAKRNSHGFIFEADGREVRPEVTHSVNKLPAERKSFSEDAESILPTEGKVVALPSKLGKKNSLKLVFEADGREVKPEVTPQVKKLSAERLQFSQKVQPNFALNEREAPSAPNLAKRNSLKLVLEADGREVRPEMRRPINKLSAERLQFTQDARAGFSVQNRDGPGRSRVEKSDSFSLAFGNNQREEFRPIRPITRFTGGDLQLFQDEYTIPEFDADSFSMDDSQCRFTQNKMQEEPRNLQSRAKISMPTEKLQVTPHLTTGDYAVIDFDPNNSSIQVHKESVPLQMGDLKQKGR